MQREDGADHQDVHDLVAIAPVVKETGAEAFGHAGDVDDSARHRQRLHGEEVAYRRGASAAHAQQPQPQEEEAKERLSPERAEAAHAAPRRHSAVNGVTGQTDVGQQGGAAQQRVAQ